MLVLIAKRNWPEGEDEEDSKGEHDLGKLTEHFGSFSSHVAQNKALHGGCQWRRGHLPSAVLSGQQNNDIAPWESGGLHDCQTAS